MGDAIEPADRQSARGEGADTAEPNHSRVSRIEALKRAAVSPSAQTRRVTAIAIGVILQAAVYVPSDWPDRRTGIAVAAGILIAALAGAFGGIWSGLAVAGAGWGFHYFFVTEDTLPPLIGLPAWLAVGALAGWLSTTRRQTAGARTHLERELAAVRASSSEAIVTVDADGTIVGWSRGAEEIYGYDADEAIGGPLTILGGEDVVAPALMAVHTAERLDIPTAVHRRKGGEEVAVSLTVTPLGQREPAKRRVRSWSPRTSASRVASTPAGARARPSTAPSPSSSPRSRTSIRSASAASRSTSARRSRPCSATRPGSGSHSPICSSSSSTRRTATA